MKSVLFVRPVGRFITRFSRRVLMHKSHEFRPWNVFMVLNRDVGAMLVPSSRYYLYAWRYEEKPSSLFKCLLRMLRHGVFVDVGAYVVLRVYGLRVLRGAIRTIKRFRPFILFKVYRTFDEEDEMYALNMLKHLDYDLAVVEPRSIRNFIIYAYPIEKGCLCCE
jgi:hypothetical protein